LYNFFLYENGVTFLLSLLKSHIDDDNDSQLMRILSCLDICSKDYEYSNSFGNNGGHQLIKRLKKKYSSIDSSNDNDSSSDMLELLESIECNIITVNIIFFYKSILPTPYLMRSSTRNIPVSTGVVSANRSRNTCQWENNSLHVTQFAAFAIDQ
jgi:hypothetical protein